ncbi:MAG: hypothetical protein A2Y57_00505 [Candidatus Woykebacteria bacterium RBG_13_40_7b]|uniref:Iron transporter n=1 Tax=Candidatus Woykebacteria bacterium RBG_13_40_7b TaxID=1802594 RepID=A0A1G1WAH9_9BACT|nr:MAG: hypothetical protein A2Y57_00505 [Candidatus Woykebacteria bacterium RBG_13_40_7b]
MRKKDLYHEAAHNPLGGKFIRDLVFGANDGVVTMIGFLTGISGAISETPTILISGIIVIISGAVSMALGNYQAVKSQKEFYKSQREIEKEEIEEEPEEEVEEVRNIYEEMGFSKGEVDLLTKKVTSDKRLWAEVMLRDELGLLPETYIDPLKSGLWIGGAYILAGLPPILPYFFSENVRVSLFWSVLVSLLILFLTGTVRARLTRRKPILVGFEVVLIGSVAALIGFLVGQVVPSA